MSDQRLQQEYLDLRDAGRGPVSAIEQMAEAHGLQSWQMARQLHGIVADPFIEAYFPVPSAATESQAMARLLRNYR